MARYLIDLTGARESTEASTVIKLYEVIEPDAHSVFLATFRQNVHVRQDDALVRVLDADLVEDDRFNDRVWSAVDELVKNSDGTDVYVCSYLPRVVAGAEQRYADVPGVHVRRLGSMLGAERTTALTAAGGLTVDQVLNLTLDVIAEQPDARVEQVRLRPLLAAANPIFNKATGPAEWKAPGFIATLLEALVSRGRIELIEGAGTVNPVFGVTPTGRAALPVRPKPAVTQTTVSVDRKVGVDGVVQEWWDLYRDAGWNPWVRFGDAPYDALIDLVTQDAGTWCASELVHRTVKQVRLQSGEQAPWSLLEKFLMRLLLVEPVLFAGTQTVGALYGPDQPKVTGLVPDFKIRLRVRLLVLLVELGGRVEYTDGWRIAAALLNERAREHDADVMRDRAINAGLLTVDGETGLLSLATARPAQGVADAGRRLRAVEGG